MKKLLISLILGILPAMALAQGSNEHGGHGSHGNDDGHTSVAGKPGDAAKVSRTVKVMMEDSMRFSPSQINVKAGETIRFSIKNRGQIPHEMVIGSISELKEHAEMMRNIPEMHHTEPNMITLAAGQDGVIVWQFDKAGVVDFACLIPGHMEAGMVGKIEVR